MKQEYQLTLTLDTENEEGLELPDLDTIAAALAHSTAAEALSEATGCTVTMELIAAGLDYFQTEHERRDDKR